ncbi:pteridine reductase [Cellvibrio polysaccharolyticus]|uniref:Pteridine reductase n=1 Tax=Cellvibrio polysaccharolyticus TaxID=2082724 RepID=A0A928V4E7_9GAMM|nr:pteridine reductase [Cellvibrio polysaccharolyticus]MBE8718540.1 pteridine reductase [Cellvibrio polysaccharolyticus]
MITTHNANPVVLITGAGRRIGATLAGELHSDGFNLVLHYRRSRSETEALAQTLNQRRPDSAIALPADLNNTDALTELARLASSHWGRLDVLINNASAFYPTPLGNVTSDTWDDLIGSNLKAPFFLAQALLLALKQQQGCIINIADIYAEKPLKEHTVYCIAKAGNVMLTKSLAQELAPDIRVNGIAPGAIFWPENVQQDNTDYINHLLHKIPLQRRGQAADIARTVRFLISDAPYITGQIIAVDGGRNLHI